MQQQDGLAEAMAILAVPALPTGMTDEGLLRETERWEALGRLVDARRIALAGEVEWRSREQLAEAGLARRHGDRNGAELLARQALIGVREAQRRIALGIRLRPRLSLQGEQLPGRYPSVAAALAAGAIGQDAARVIVEGLGAVARRAEPDDLAAAEAALVGAARDLAPDLVQMQATVWQARLDPDGAEPSDAAAQRQRSFRLGVPRSDGTTRSVLTTPSEETALLRAILNAHRRGVQWERTPSDDCEDDLEWHEAQGDGRTKAQFDFDTILAVLRAGVAAEADVRAASGAAPVEVVVQVTAHELEQRRGAGWLDDVLARVPIPQVQRMQCSGGTRLLVIGDAGEPLYLGKGVRLFSRPQRRALAARDGGCAWPGCRAPVAWTEAHHIRWFARDDGPSDIDNGVLLCSHHHHLIHATKEWEIRVHDGAPHLVPQRWRGAPLRRHRMQRHPMRSAASGAPPGG